MEKSLFYVGIICCMIAASHSQGFNGVGNGGTQNNGQNNRVPSTNQGRQPQGSAADTEQDCEIAMMIGELVDGDIFEATGVKERCEEKKREETAALESANPSPTPRRTMTTQTPRPTSRVPPTQAATRRVPPSQSPSPTTTSALPPTRQRAASSTRNLITPSTTRPTPSTQPPTPSSTLARRPSNVQPSGRVPNFAPPGHIPNTRPPANSPTTTTRQPTTTTRQPTTTTRQPTTTTRQPTTTTRQPTTTTTQPPTTTRQASRTNPSPRPSASMVLPDVKPTIPNNCGVRLVAQSDCREFNGQRCGAKTRFDIDQCVCAHELSVDPSTCKTSPY